MTPFPRHARGGAVRARRRFGLARLLLLLMILPGPALAQGATLGVLEWHGYGDRYLWRLEWDPVARHTPDGWQAVPADERSPVDTVHAPGATGVFLPHAWEAAPVDCETTAVAVGGWLPGAIPLGHRLDAPLPALTKPGWDWWPLRDPAQVWKHPDRPGELAEALAGLTRHCRETVSRDLPPGLEVDPDVPWTREGLRLARPVLEGALELVGSYRGAVRLRGGGASSPAVLHFWIGVEDGVRRFRYALLDLPGAGVARRERLRVGVLVPPAGTRPLVVFRETAVEGERYVFLEMLSSGLFRPVFESPWGGCR